MPTVEPTFVFLARGKLFLRVPGEKPREITSPFATQVLERQQRDRELNGWKGRSGVWAGMGVAPPNLNQWQEAEQTNAREPRVTAVARGATPGKIVYVLDLFNVGGLFEYDLERKLERRLMHQEGFEASALAVHPQTGMFVLALARENHSVRLATSEQEGRYLSIVSAGDCVDQNPAWLPGDQRRLLFQSAPIGRTAEGFALGLGPYAIRRADLADEQMTTLLESPTNDFLEPRPAADGGIYYIRRPYKPPGERRVNPWDALLDIVLFPYRFLRAVFHFFNFFSLMFSGKPLATTLGSPPPNKTAPSHLMLWGQMIDTKKALAEVKPNSDAGLVPQDWKLIRRAPDGAEQVLASNVLSYDLTPAGDVIFTNGAAVFLLTSGGDRTRLCPGELIERVLVTS